MLMRCHLPCVACNSGCHVGQEVVLLCSAMSTALLWRVMGVQVLQYWDCVGVGCVGVCVFVTLYFIYCMHLGHCLVHAPPTPGPNLDTCINCCINNARVQSLWLAITWKWLP